MRCKVHTTDLSSVDGVCASCLRERLFKLILAQEQAQAQSLAQNQSNLNANQPLPRSGSPYISHRKIDNPVVNHVAVQRPRLNHSLSDHRFYNSPQVAINTGGCIGGGSSKRQKQSLIRFSSFSKLFRSNGSEGDSNSNSNSNSNHRASVSTSSEPSGAGGKPTSVTSSPLLLPNGVPPGAGVRQKNKAIHVTEASTSAALRKQRYVPDRGMSPVGTSDNEGEDELSNGSTEYESAESIKPTPKMTPSHPTVRRGGGQRTVSELIFCLSPLVRASPSRLWNLKGKPPVDGGDIRPPAAPHLSDAKSFCANRSRKLADFGRSHPNR